MHPQKTLAGTLGWADMLDPHKGLELDLKIVFNRKINDNKLLFSAKSKVVVLGDTVIYKTNHIQDSAPWVHSIGLPRLILHGIKWTNMLQNGFA